MKVRTVTYIGSFADGHPFPAPQGPEIVFLGRSNVGKSSLINTLVGRRGIARTSNTPGKTRTANYYLINEKIYFVDMPGYGYAQVSKRERARWQNLIAVYLAEREVLRGIVQLLDIRHAPSGEDREAASTLRQTGRPVCLAFNKIDKVKKSSVEQRIANHVSLLDVDPGSAVIPFSSETGEGKRELWAWISDSCLAKPHRAPG